LLVRKRAACAFVVNPITQDVLESACAILRRY
jgi:hypothetical protein